MDLEHPSGRPRPQMSGSPTKINNMQTTTAQSDATTGGVGSFDTPPEKESRRATANNIGAEQPSTQARLSGGSNMMALPFRNASSTAGTPMQSSQTDDILHSDAYLSARKLLNTARGTKAHANPIESVVADAAVTHSCFAELLTCLMSHISAGGRDSSLPDVLLGGLRHLVTCIEETRSATVHSTPASTVTSLETTTLAIRPRPAKSSAPSAFVSTKTMRSTDATKAPTENVRTTTLPIRSHPANRVSLLSPVSTPAAQTFRFSSLTLEAKIRTLSFVPARDVALNCRLVFAENSAT